MKKKKGFTLIELLAVLALLAIIMAVTFPNFTKLSNKAKENYDRSTQILLVSAAKMYINNNPEEMQNKNNVCVQVGKLVALEYLDSELKTKNGTAISDDQCIRITKNTNSGKVEYKYSVTFGDKVSGDYLPPLITIRKKAGSTSTILCSKVITFSEVGDNGAQAGENKYIKEYDDNCEITVTDNSLSDSITFQKVKDDDINSILDSHGDLKIKLEKVVTVDGNKLFIKYNATDKAGNKAIPLNVQLTIPE